MGDRPTRVRDLPGGVARDLSVPAGRQRGGAAKLGGSLRGCEGSGRGREGGDGEGGVGVGARARGVGVGNYDGATTVAKRQRGLKK